MSRWHYATSAVVGAPGGQAVRVVETCRTLARHVDVVLFAPVARRPADLALPPNLRLVDVPLPPRPAASLRFDLRLRAALRREPAPDVFYRRASSANFLSLAHARRCGALSILEVDGLRVDDYALEHPARGLAARAALTARRAVWERTADLDHRLATVTVAVSDELAAHLARRHRLTGDRLAVVANGVDLETFRPGPTDEARAELGLPRGGVLVGFVGTFAAWQGLDTLMAALARAGGRRADLALLMVGDGSQAAALRSLVVGLGVADRVIWRGWQARREVAACIRACDLAVAPFAALPRNDAMGSSSLKVREYLASGRPVVATSWPGHEFIEREDVGLLAAPGDADDLAVKLLELAANPERRREMGRRARRLAETRFSWDVAVAPLLALAERTRAAAGRGE